MRRRKKNANISVHAIAGTRVVLLGLDATPKAKKGLLGFTIYKRKGKGKEIVLGGGKIFAGVHPPSNAPRLRSDKAPIQGFMWSDYVVDPDTSYTYRVVPVYGTPDKLKPQAGVKVTIKTEALDDGKHGIFFNRGVAGSQAYARQFGEYRRWVKVPYKVTNRKTGAREQRYKWTPFLKPSDVPEEKAFKWLSRGLEEGMLDFIAQAKDDTYSLRASVYEFTHRPAIEAFVTALENGADVKIVHHAKTVVDWQVKSSRRPRANPPKKGPKTEPTATITIDYVDDTKPNPKVHSGKRLLEGRKPDGITQAANDAVAAVGVSSWDARDAFDRMMIPRTKPSISHNKFIVLLKNGTPVQVWTGSTNYTGGGIYGQSNVGHVVRDEAVAQRYYEYWQQLSDDPAMTDIKKWNLSRLKEFKQVLPEPDSITPVFSPRPTTKMLAWIANRMKEAKNSVHLTLAFTVAKEVLKVVKQPKAVSGNAPFARYLLLDGKGGLMKKPFPAMQKVSQNHIAWGETMRPRKRDEEAEYERHLEALTGLNENVNYLHTKYLLIDPLTDDPVVITGSANFSDPSIEDNDENFVIIRGDTRVADIYLGEFMRLFNHFESRNKANQMSPEEAQEHAVLCPDDSWTKPYFKKDDPSQQERLLFR